MSRTNRTRASHRRTTILVATLAAGCATASTSDLHAPLPSASAPTADAGPETSRASGPAATPARVPEEGNAAAEMARKLQNPLANIKAVVNDNVIGLNTGVDEGTSYGFQLQPVYAIDMPERGFTFIPRAVIPFVGLEPGTKIPPIATPPQASDRVWGLGDVALQAFFAPHSEAKWKWGVGPQLSLPTATDSRLRGADFGGGVAGVVTGALTPELSLAAIVGNMWAFDGSFNLGLIQPILMYNVSALPGAWVGYNAGITANWEATSSNVWTVPVGVSIGRTFDLGGGRGFDFGFGPYYNAVSPDGAADWTLRFGLTFIFP